MKPMLGRWVIDVEATMQANAFHDEEARRLLRRELEANPFELEITDREYTSRGPVKTNWDLYTLAAVEGDTVTIRLKSPQSEAPGRERKVKLRVRDGRLVIRPMSTLPVVMTRPAPVSGSR